MVQPQGDMADFNKGKKEFRRSMKKREKVDLYKIRKQRMLLQQKQEEEQEDGKIDGNENNHSNSQERLLFRTAADSTSNVSDKSDHEGPPHHNSEGNLRRFSRIIDAPQSIMEYKDLIKSISLQLFSKSNSSSGVNKNSSPRSAKYTPFGTGDETLDRTFDSADEDFRTRNFVLTQKFIGWKV